MIFSSKHNYLRFAFFKFQMSSFSCNQLDNVQNSRERERQTDRQTDREKQRQRQRQRTFNFFSIILIIEPLIFQLCFVAIGFKCIKITCVPKTAVRSKLILASSQLEKLAPHPIEKLLASPSPIFRKNFLPASLDFFFFHELILFIEDGRLPVVAQMI